MSNTSSPARPSNSPRERAHLLGRALSSVRRTFSVRHLPFVPSAPADGLPLGAELERLVSDSIASHGGEIAASARAARLGHLYAQSADREKAAFLLLLRERFGPNQERLDERLRLALESADETAREDALQQLRRALDPPRLTLFRRLSAMPEGIRFLVDLRADVLRLRDEHPSLAVLDQELKGLLSAWFDLGLLELRRIDWNAPAALLEQVIAHEAVHAIRSWDDLRNRLDGDRRVYALFHPSISQMPLIFLEVALVRGLASSVQELLDEQSAPLDPRHADTAVFYSISNALRGLDGISFGRYLIARVLELLSAELPNLKTFATLSPLPGFRAWLDAFAGDPESQAALHEVLGSSIDPVAVADALNANQSVDDADLERLAAYYLTHARGRGARALDPVAHFHLGNGARIARINRQADTSPRGLHQSAALMVNYRYVPDDLALNLDAYASDGIIPLDPAIRRLLRPIGAPVQG